MKLINLTPHVIKIHNPERLLVALDSTDEIARVEVTTEPQGSIGDIIIYRNTYSDVTGVPAPVDGVSYVVSAIVRLALPNRSDVLSPGDLLRSPEGQPIGCLGLVQN